MQCNNSGKIITLIIICMNQNKVKYFYVVVFVFLSFFIYGHTYASQVDVTNSFEIPSGSDPDTFGWIGPVPSPTPSTAHYARFCYGTYPTCTGTVWSYYNGSGFSWNSWYPPFNNSTTYYCTYNGRTCIDGDYFMQSSPSSDYSDGTYILFRRVSGGYLPPYVDTSTHFIEKYPINGTTTPSNTVTVGFDVFRGSDDYDRYPYICYDLDRLDFVGSFNPVHNCQYYAVSGDVSYSTSTVLSSGYYSGIYYFYSLDDDLKALATSTYFTVVQSAVDQLEDNIDNLYGTSTGATSIESCMASSTAPISQIIPLYVKCLIFPQPGMISNLVTSFKSDVLKKVPWGYATRLYDIYASSTGTTTLPSISYTIPSGLPSSGKTIDFTPWQGSIDAINKVKFASFKATTTDYSNAYDEFLYYWNMLWWIMGGMYLLSLMFKFGYDVMEEKTDNLDHITPIQQNSRRTVHLFRGQRMNRYQRDYRWNEYKRNRRRM